MLRPQFILASSKDVNTVQPPGFNDLSCQRHLPERVADLPVDTDVGTTPEGVGKQSYQAG